MLHLKKGLLLTTQLLDAGPWKLFPNLCDDERTAAPDGNRQVYALEPQPELSARDEEEISEQTHYPYINLLQCFRIFLAGISEQLLQEPRQSFGWVLGAALPLFPFLHFGSANRHKAQVSCTPEGNLPREQGSEGFSWERTPPKTQFWQVMAVPTAKGSDRTTPPHLCSRSEVLVTQRMVPSSCTTSPSCFPIHLRRSVPVTHIPAAPPTAHRADLGHQRISLHPPPSLSGPWWQWEDTTQLLNTNQLQHLCEAMRQSCAHVETSVCAGGLGSALLLAVSESPSFTVL